MTPAHDSAASGRTPVCDRRVDEAACGPRRRGAVPLALLGVATALALGAVAARGDWGPAPGTLLTPPSISGAAAINATLTALPGTWVVEDDQTGAPQYRYQWLRCDAGGANCAQIAGATASTYVVIGADAGDALRVQVIEITSEDDGDDQSASAPGVSAATAPVPLPPVNIAAPVPLPPMDSAPPTVSLSAPQGAAGAIQGPPHVGDTLIASSGVWSGTQPLVFSFQWLQCDAAGAACAAIGGATGVSYSPSDGDVGDTLRVLVTATNAAGWAGAESAATPAVTLVPVLHVSELVRPLGGSVRVRSRGSKRFAELHAQALIPDGSTIDATSGQLTLTVADDAEGHTSTADLHGGSFRVKQELGAHPLTDLALQGVRLKCPSADIARASSSSVWAHDSGGHFSTRGRYASAIVRGTTWATTELCEGTLVQVYAGSVTVFDRTKRRTVTIGSGHEYLAHAPEPMGRVENERGPLQ
jgi:hypothetical protein